MGRGTGDGDTGVVEELAAVVTGSGTPTGSEAIVDQPESLVTGLVGDTIESVQTTTAPALGEAALGEAALGEQVDAGDDGVATLLTDQVTSVTQGTDGLLQTQVVPDESSTTALATRSNRWTHCCVGRDRR